jgi:hypothetical protein
MEHTRPRARSNKLICEEIDGELVIYDQLTDRITQLNHSAAVVWRACDGNRSLAELLAFVQPTLGELADEDVVQVALDYLTDSDLLEAGVPARTPLARRQSRRRFIQRAGTVGIAATLLPVVYSLAAPTPADAGSNPVVTVPGGGGPTLTFTFGGG